MMRLLTLLLASLVGLTACGNARAGAGDNPRPPPVPTTVACNDAPQLRQRAAADRHQADVLSSDQKKIELRNRAGFLASLAIIAELKCKVSSAGIDDALKPALDAAREAEALSSFYESTLKWGEADFMATQVIEQLTQRLPATGDRR